MSFKRLPNGFVEISDVFHPMSVKADLVRRVLLSDGMRSVSVYDQFDVTADSSNPIGLSTLGGISAYGRRLGSAFATVIGELPTETIQKIADALVVNTVIPIK